MKYQPAVDGLRAIAVILVLLFHAELPLFSGGYVGVDVFFVISGYLITNLICREHISGSFTVSGFYERRIRRILPALYLVVLSTLVIGTFVLVPTDLARLGSSAVAATAFVSNFYFWIQGDDYLLGRTEFMPLLHTWSLAIEEQFYVVFPVFTLLVLRFFKRRLGSIFLGLALCSFALSVYLALAHPRAAFYVSPGRAWELLLGACIAVGGAKDLAPRRLRPMLQAAGLGMILGAALAYDLQTPFPGLAALVPCFGTALVIAWCEDDARVIGALGHPTLVWFGLISYPLYLWHWPLLVLTKLVLLRELRGYEIVAVYSLAIVLATATWHYLEKPIRGRKGSVPAGRVFALAAGATCIALIAGSSLRATGGLLGTPPPEVARIMAAAKDYAPGLGRCHNWDRRHQERLADCIIGDRASPEFHFALWGDSQAGALATAVDSAAQSVGRKGLQLTMDNCPPFFRTQVIERRETLDCEARNEVAFDLMRTLGIRRAVLVGQWFQYTQGNEREIALRPNDKSRMGEDAKTVFENALRETVRRLRNAGIDVTIVGPVPYVGWNVPAVLSTRLWRNQPLPAGPKLTDFMSSQLGIITLLREIARDNVGVIYPHERLCLSKCLVELNGEILYSDDEHLTTRGADLLRPMLAKEISRTK
jgi:peptidoglycan/LPS O-acetylase OafA/YrhL